MRMKVQVHSSIEKSERAHQVLMPPTNKSIASTQMDVDHQKIGRKISDLHGQKATTECMITREIITNLGVSTQAEAEAKAKAKTNLSIASSTKEILTIGQGTILSS
jgi:hypothetical protein